MCYYFWLSVLKPQPVAILWGYSWGTFLLMTLKLVAFPYSILSSLFGLDYHRSCGSCERPSLSILHSLSVAFSGAVLLLGHLSLLL